MQLGWIDFSREDKAKALDTLRLLQEETAIDELGFGVIRDAFANRFFPGTSTVQTRAKYFLIIPYMLKDALSGKMGTDEQTVYRKFHILERECARKLLGNGATEGVIGRNSLPRGRWVVRAPSDIYWTGLRLYKIVKSGRPLRDLLNLYCRILGQDESSSGDDPFTDDTEDTCALDVVGVYEDDWFENLDIDLTRKEAIFLREKILSSDGESLLKLALKKNIPLRSYPDFAAFAASIQGSVSPRMKNLVRLAVEFNEVVFAARVRFGLILSDFRDADLKDES